MMHPDGCAGCSASPPAFESIEEMATWFSDRGWVLSRQGKRYCGDCAASLRHLAGQIIYDYGAEGAR